MTKTEEFVKCILSANYDSLPPEAIDIARQVALDGLSVMLAGSTEPSGLARMITQYARESGCTPEATVVAGGFKTSIYNAAFANGTIAHALDFDNAWFPPNHPVSPTLPAILAMAEKFRLSGRAIIEAIVTAFEVQGRVRMALTGKVPGQGFHPPGTTGIMGATAAAVKLLDLDRAQALMAFGIAASRAGSLNINTGTMTKSSHSGHSARMGVECGILAKMGWTAHPDIFGPGGFCDTFGGGKGDTQLLTEGFGEPYRMIKPGVGFKKHPCNYVTHRPIDAALSLREKYKIDPAQVDHVQVTFAPFEYVNRPQPATGLDGKFSVQYTTTVALLDGEITIDSFTDKRRFSPDVVNLLPRVELVFDDSIPTDFQKMHSTVNVWLKDGRRLTGKCEVLTGWDVPLTRDQRLKKYYSCALRVLEKGDADRLLALVESLEKLSEITEIMKILRAER